MRKPTDLSKLVPDPHGLLPLTEAVARRRRVKAVANAILAVIVVIACYMAYPHLRWVIDAVTATKVAVNESPILEAHPFRNYKGK